MVAWIRSTSSAEKCPFGLAKINKVLPRADGKLLRKVKIQPGLSVPCEQSDHIKRFHVNEVSYQIIQLIENSSGAAVW